ncbi:FxSxx-COOH system tetratricopeptide repeat protein [Actinomadura sp. DC4]|uniref:FxSxx-COOH system tetratricopeptide repeat protein n=1 Tax=Actinomadura sp. DC4 TaxID=3055069 RepID=UPI0025B03E0F|nr:FxSxx-COOH system tetratricopeptide repeat protein [Actinomadura sp. DC4]MDN3354131.1 FxSxx-COOH system tetratricopeptide repeat protein [Actinomadura sp. DC4]
MPEVWGGIPGRNRNFTGRVELLQLLRARIGDAATAVVPSGDAEAEGAHALQGMGGVGKTQLAIEYVWQYRSEYELVWWIPADQPTSAVKALADLAPSLNLPPPSVSGHDEAAKAVLAALSRGEPYARWLLVFDNANDPKDLKDLIPVGPGHVILTTRNYNWRGVVETLEINVFRREESVEFLLRRVPAAISTGDADRLAEELGDLPLALEQAAALKAETGISVDEYLRLLGERADELLDQTPAAGYPKSMSATCSVSVTTLESRLPEAVELLRCLAFFGPDPIPPDVLRRSAGLARPLLREVLSDPIMLTRAVSELNRFALVKVNPQGRTIQIHRLVQALLREQLSAEDQASLRHDVHVLLSKSVPGGPDEVRQWPRFAALVPHLEPARVTESIEHDVRVFVLDVVRYLYQSGGRQTAQAIVEDLLRRWEDEPGGQNDRLLLTAQTRRGDILRELGDYALAAETDRAAHDRAKEIFGNDDAATLSAARALGGDLRALGDFAAAAELDEESRARHVQAFGEDDPRTLRSINNLALDYGLIGRYGAARELHKRAFIGQRDAAAGDINWEVLGSWNGLARVIRQHGEYRTARDIGEEALERGRQELGAEHPWTLRTGRDLSIALRRTGAWQQALDMAQDVYQRCKRLFGLNNPDTLAAATCLANAERTVGHIDEAFDRAQDVARRYSLVYGPAHPFTLACEGNVALLHRVQNAVEKARELDEKCLAGLKAKVGQDHHYSLNVAINLASDLAALHELDRACALGEETLERVRGALGDKHPVALGCAANLIIDLRALGAEDKAAAFAAVTLSNYEQALFPEHPDVKTARAGRHLDFDFDPPLI